MPLLAGAVEDVPMTQNEKSATMDTAKTAEFHPKLEKANELIGADILNDKNQELGTIEEIVLNPERTAVNYAVLSHGGFWGWGGKLFAVPWSQFRMDADGDEPILPNVTPADLENAKGFDKARWPITATERWLGEEVANPTAARADIKYRKLSELVGLTVKNMEGEDLGELENLVIDMHEGRLALAVLSMRRGFLNLDEEFAIVPWSSVEVLPRLGTARLDADKETLQAIAFDDDEFPNLEDREYSRKVYERFDATPYWETLGYVPGASQEHPERSPWKAGSEYDSLYNADTARTIHGTIASVGTFRPEGSSVAGLRLRVKTDDGATVTVHAGPRPYVEAQKFSFHYGDAVTITGSPAESGWREFIVASQIKKGDETLDLRTKEGKPRWNPDDFKESR